MFKFLALGSIAPNTLITGINLYDSDNNQIGSTLDKFSGSIMKDIADLGDYLTIELDVELTKETEISKIELLSDGSSIAESDTLSIIANETGNFVLRFSALFEGAGNCDFKEIHVALPSASSNKEGVVRLANKEETDEFLKEHSVYSAKDIDSLLGDSNDANVPWDKEDGEVIHGSVTVDHITLLDSIDPSLSDGNKATIALSDDGSSIEIKGAVISGDAVQSDYKDSENNIVWNKEENETKLPTVHVLKEVNNNLQEQIDALNAGQNLADIVGTTEELADLPLDDLKALGDDDGSGDIFSVGDKVQVLEDTYIKDGEVQTEDGKVSTVYELRKGETNFTEYPKDITSAYNSEYFWRYIGRYGSNSYSKVESDDRYVLLSSETPQEVESSLNVSGVVNADTFGGGGVYTEFAEETWEDENSANLIPTVSAVQGAIENNLLGVSSKDLVGSVGLFLLDSSSEALDLGDEVDGTHLSGLVMTLTKSGRITYAQSDSTMTGTWRLMSAAPALEGTTNKALVLAQKIEEAPETEP